MAKIGKTRDRLPTGSLPINQTPWSGDHAAIKDGIAARANDKVFIDPENSVWLENADGTFTFNGPAGSYTGSGQAKGRRGKDRQRRGS